MDAGRQRNYMHRMTRLLFALLALLTGLAAQLNPAQARACAGAQTEIGAVVAPRVSSQRVAPAARVWMPARHGRLQAEDPAGPAMSEQVPVVPTVYQGIDRARE